MSHLASLQHRFFGLRPPTAHTPGYKAALVSRCDTPRSRSLARVSAAAKTDQSLEQLRQENKALRRELAKLQNVKEDDVTFTVEEEPVPEAEPSHKERSASNTQNPRARRKDKRSSSESLEAGIEWPTADEAAAWERPPRHKPWQGGKRAKGDTPKDSKLLQIVHVSAELAPHAKVGGLGDVVAGLSRACLERGHSVEVILPYYQSLPEDQIEGLQHVKDFDVPKGRFHDGYMHHGTLRTSAFRGTVDGIPVILLRPDWQSTNIFQGSRIYGGSYNETEAYLYFSRASLQLLSETGCEPDILHVHEWQAAAVPMLFWEHYYPRGLRQPRLVFTIHNLDSQGECRQDEFAASGIDGTTFADVNKALDERTIGHNPERLSLMKGGIVYSNQVTTVSPTYAQEALQGGAAGWLRSTFARPDIAAKFTGVLNGIDAGAWDPIHDHFLPAPFDHDDLAGKALCKGYLQKALHMAEAPEKPLVAVITRLVPQKGIHLIKHAVYRTLELGGQFVLLGTGHADRDFRAMTENDLRDNRDVRLKLMYSDALAHLIYAAADIILVPSLFEPCGLTQLVGMRYGAVPVVRRTGGLADTVKDISEGDGGNGFTFDGVDNASVNSALDRALQAFREQPDLWRQLVSKNMLLDSTWQTSASQYLDIYRSLV